jgi:hypothetical protein
MDRYLIDEDFIMAPLYLKELGLVLTRIEYSIGDASGALDCLRNAAIGRIIDLYSRRPSGRQLSFMDIT